jgi:tryptophan-rich sensory protein
LLNRLAVFGLFILSVSLAASVGGIFPPGEWYNKELVLPTWTPPDSVFGPVWTFLYALIAYAGYRVWQRVGWKSKAHGLFFLQLILNASWTAAFFGLHAPMLSLAIIVVLAILIFATLVTFRHHDEFAGWLLLPYLLWVVFAASLNAGIVVLNAA